MKKSKYPNILAELSRNGLTIGELADYLGQTRQNVYKKLNGQITINLKDMQKIQNFFESYGGTFTLDYLFTETI